MLYYEKIINENTDEWVLFIHGLGGSLKTWKYQIDQFTPYYNVLLVDLDGHGRSSRLKLFSRYKPTSTAKEIHEILLTECISHVKIVSLSLGTLVALEFSYLYPDMVESMVLAGGIINLDHARRFVFGVANFVTKHCNIIYQGAGTETYIVEGFDDAIGILALINDCMNQYWNPDQDGEVRVDTFFSVGRYIIQVSEWEEIWEDEL